MKNSLKITWLLASVIISSLSAAGKAAAVKSLDEIDRESWGPVVAPSERAGVKMTPVRANTKVKGTATDVTSLSGEWEMVEDSGEPVSWNNAITAKVPCSVHTALSEAGRIPDPLLGMNDSIALQNSYKGWWLRKKFRFAGDPSGMELNFNGVANYCTVWLNGKEIARHEGMFGGPTADVSKILRKGDNELVVKLEPVPNIATGMTGIDRDSWRNTVVINCVYGWHYAKIMPLGIWRDVELRRRRDTEINNPFIITRDTVGNMRLVADVRGIGTKGKVRLRVTPKNFTGKPQCFEAGTDGSDSIVCLDFTLDNPQLWWPNDMGPQNLYNAEIEVTGSRGSHRTHTTFGIRTITMSSFPSGKSPDRYNWVMNINGREMFVKGSNWCSVDALLRFDRRRYDSMLSAARQQHLQLLRAWGGGAPETDIFYEMCDSLGLMVFQEWPTAWNSHDEQPFDVLSETVRLNTLRIRNHPSLVMWGGGNESNHPFGRAIDMMGRASIELDGTRPFHRGEPWGGSRHDYGCWWGDLHLNHNLNMTADFWGEYGIPSMPDRETVDRYLDGEQYSFPVAMESRFNHHMPVFGGVNEMHKAEQLCRYFCSPDSLDDFIIGTQLAQTVGGCSVIERARTRRPLCAGVWYYKLNDVYPALSWSSVDYYGCRKPYHYFLCRSMVPEATVILFDRTNVCSQAVDLPYYLLDDFSRLRGDSVTADVTVYNYYMHPVYHAAHTVVPDSTVVRLPDVKLTAGMADSQLLLFKTDLRDASGALIARNWYFSGYETDEGILFNFPGSVRCGDRLKCERIDEGHVRITNTAGFPAVGVTLRMPEHQHELRLSDNYLWLDAGESADIEINIPGVPEVTAWNH